jgi:hypothetical protein
MAVAFDAIGSTIVATGNVTSGSGTPITVGASATLLIVGIYFSNGGLDTTQPTGISVTWNGVAMTLITNSAVLNLPWTNGAHNAIAYLFGLVSPASGARTLAASWTNGAEALISSISFTGTLISSVAAACPNPQNNTGSFSGASISWPWTLTTVPGDFAVALGGDARGDTTGQTPGTNTTQWDLNTAGGSVTYANMFAIYSTTGATGASLTLNDTVSNPIADLWAGVATNITGPAAQLLASGGVGGHFARRVNVVEY